MQALRFRADPLQAAVSRWFLEAFEDDSDWVGEVKTHFPERNLGRWFSRYGVGEWAHPGMYSFCHSSTLSYVDPDGLSALSVALPVAGGAAAIDGPLPVGDAVALAALAAAAIYDALNRDDTIDIPVPRAVPRSRRRRRQRWTCNARCNVHPTAGTDPKCCPPRTEGVGYGSTRAIADKAARRTAQIAIRGYAGCVTKHCHSYKCTKN